MASKKISYDFTEIFPFNENMAKSIADSIIARGYDKTQVIHLFKTRDIHTFHTRTEVSIYAHELQILRRNLEPYQILDAIAKLDKLKNTDKKASAKLRPFKFKSGEIKYGK